MKKFLLSFAAFVVLTISLISCGNSNSPKATAEKFVTGLTHLDFEAAKAVSTEETKNMLNMLAQFSQMAPDSVRAKAKDIKVTMGEEKIEGDKATVYYTTSDDPSKQQKVDLVKQDGKWLVAWSKNDGAEGNTPAEEPSANETPLSEDTAAVGTEVPAEGAQ